MRTLTWDRDAQVRAIRDRIWLYLTPAAQIETLALDAAALLQLPERDVMTLARVEFLLHPAVTALLDDLPLLLRRLATTSEQVEERSTERVRGAIDWPATLTARTTSRIPALFVSRPSERAYQTRENELLVFILDQIMDLAAQTGWSEARSTLGAKVHEIGATAEWWRNNRMLAQVERQTPTDRSLAQIRASRNRRRYQRALDVYDIYEPLIRTLNRSALQKLVEEVGLLTRDDAVLFELSTTFDVIDALHDLGWTTDPLHVFSGRLQLQARRDNSQLTLWYQTTPPALRQDSRYRAVLNAHGFARPSDLRPDIVLRVQTPTDERWLVIEVKMGTSRTVADSARAALNDLLAYRRAFDPTLHINPLPYGLGVVWGEGLVPTAASETMLCTPDHLRTALAAALH